MKQDERYFLSLIKVPCKVCRVYGTGVLDGMGVREATGVFVGRRVGDGGTVFVGVGDGNGVGVTISFAR